MKTTGDGVLVEFASVVQAVQCAAAIQAAMCDSNAGVPDERRLRYRVGINIGDVIVDDDDIRYGQIVRTKGRLREC